MKKVSALIFLCAMLLVLLFQPVVGVAAKGKPPNKPDKPGKPKTATFRIWIGAGEDHVVLTSTDHFDVVASVDGWNPDEGKQKGRDVHRHVWRIPLYADRYGFYEMESIFSDEYGNYLTDFYTGELAQLGWLEHHWKRGEYDDWTIDFNWNSGMDLDGDGVDDPYFLDGWTGHTPEEEGTYDPITDTWTVTFNSAYFDIDWWGPGGDNGKHVVWDGYLTFTVTVQKMPNT